MLHEVLLGLSGHPTPLFKADVPDTPSHGFSNSVNHDFPDLSPSEASMLDALGRIAILHRQLKAHLRQITLSHSSLTCRAVGSSVLHTHLRRFQDKILAVEESILSKSPEYVGAYNIVPLSAIVIEFDDWSRLMPWYWQTASTVRTPNAQLNTDLSEESSSAAIIDYLRTQSQTGYPEIETAAKELSAVAESVWLRQCCSWILHGQLPTHGRDDHFVSLNPEMADTMSIQLVHSKLPAFVSQSTASSMLFIGRSLHQLRIYQKAGKSMSSSVVPDEAQLVSTHLKLLSNLSFPLTPVIFARTIASIRSSLSKNVLQHLISPREVQACLTTLRQFFLLERGEFAGALITAADICLNERQARMGKLLQRDLLQGVRGTKVTDGELAETLAQTWKTLTLVESDHDQYQPVEHARDVLRLEFIPDKSSLRGANNRVQTSPISDGRFFDVLFPIKSQLTMQTPPPLDLILSPSDMQRYSAINAYLLAVRRAHQHLSGLWKLAGARRNVNKDRLQSQLAQRQSISLRKVWASCSSALFLLSETSAYLEGEIVKCSWDKFHDWALGHKQVEQTRNSVAASGRSLHEQVQDMHLSDTGGSTQGPSEEQSQQAALPHDPETLAAGHRAFLSALEYAVLLTDDSFMRTVRTFITNIDLLIGYFERLQSLRADMSLMPAESIPQFTLDEESQVELELDRARKRTDSDMKSLVIRLRGLDEERIGAGRYLDLAGNDTGGFVPWREGGGVDRLLMKLDFGRMTEIEARDRDLIV